MIIAALGILTSALYVGFLALKIHSVPLWIIVIGTFVLVIREFAVEFLGLGAAKKGNDAQHSR